eukprot:TRINITY_DN6626_c0_g1_i1.p1 TRINITY_DN6626_c0_g1~~TRINITY_DN6626_c0_g1_i1.p1  ORF type:complete len:63 (+),score=6.23 TRINITY_DN6626_c0_g1_i1:63-251(+)
MAWGYRGDAKIVQGEFAEAVKDWEKAAEIMDAITGYGVALQMPKKRLKMSERKDYYKILGTN